MDCSNICHHGVNIKMHKGEISRILNSMKSNVQARFVDGGCLESPLDADNSHVDGSECVWDLKLELSVDTGCCCVGVGAIGLVLIRCKLRIRSSFDIYTQIVGCLTGSNHANYIRGTL